MRPDAAHRWTGGLSGGLYCRLRGNHRPASIAIGAIRARQQTINITVTMMYRIYLLFATMKGMVAATLAANSSCCTSLVAKSGPAEFASKPLREI